MRKLSTVLVVLLSSGAALAADMAGSHDPQYLKRFQGTDIVSFTTRSFDHYTFALGPGTPGGQGFVKSEPLEGAVTRVVYHIGPGHTPLEALRNYEHMLGDLGLKQSYEMWPAVGMWAGYFTDGVWGQAGRTDSDPFGNMDSGAYGYAYYKGTKDGKTLGVAVLVAQIKSPFNMPVPGAKGPLAVKPGDMLIGVDEVIAGQPGNSMTK